MTSRDSQPPRSLPALWSAPLLDPSGYADEARGFLCALERCGYEVAARQIGHIKEDAGLSPEHLATVRRALDRPAPTGEFAFVHHHQPATGQRLHPNGPNVSRTMFETDRIPRAWRPRLLEVDAVWVPAEFNVETFMRGGVPGDLLHVLPATLDFELFSHPGVEPLPLTGARGFVFLSAFDFTDRKGWDVLLEAWARAFGPDDDVSLVLKCLTLHGVTVESIRERIDSFLGGRETAPIVLNTELLPASTLPRLYAAADAFVLSSRSEGWGRPLMEAMAMALPTIGSRWSGNLAFMNDGNSWLAEGAVGPIRQWDPVHPSLWQGASWFEPDPDSVASLLREVYAGGAEVRRRARWAASDLRERFSSQVAAARVVELLELAFERWNWRRSRPVACVWRGEFGSGHSLAIVNDGVVGTLQAAGEPVLRLAPESEPAVVDAVGVAQHWPPAFEAPASGPFVLYQPWEFGRVPERWVEQIRQLVDEVWAPSESVREAYVASGVPAELVHVVPNAVDLETFAPAGPARSLPTTKSTVFLFVGGLVYRKGVDLLLEAFARAFTADDDVCLAIKSFGAGTIYDADAGLQQLAAFAARPGAPELVLLDEDVPPAELPALYRAADVLVQPYRAEGFCLPALEALACGVPVIVTAGGPTDEFVSDDCGWRVASRRAPLPDGSLPPDYALAGEGFVLEADVDALVQTLREAAHPERRASRAAAAREHAERFPWDRAAQTVRDRLEALSNRPPVRRLPRALVPSRRSVLFAVIADWERCESWAEPVVAYARAFAPDDEVTLVLSVVDEHAALALVAGELERAGLRLDALPDIALAEAAGMGPESLALAADVVICADGNPPLRARRVLPPDPSALRALVGSR